MRSRVKKPEERKQEILEAAIRLFEEKGYEQTVVSDIVQKAGVAQGTFYLYYKSKDDIFTAVLKTISEEIMNQLDEVQRRDDLNAVEKLNLIVKLETALNQKQHDLFQVLHLEKNAGVHQKYIIYTINRLKPVYMAIIEQGIKEGAFNTTYPEEAAEFMLVALKFMFDSGVFPLNQDILSKKIRGIQDISERILGAARNSIHPFD